MTVDNICICVSPSMMHTKEWGSSEGVRRSTLQFVESIQPLKAFLALLIAASESVNLEKMGIHFSFD